MYRCSIYSQSVLHMASKHNSRKVMKFWYRRKNYSLNVKNVSPKLVSRQVMKFCALALMCAQFGCQKWTAQIQVLRVLTLDLQSVPNCARNMTRAKGIYSCIGAQHATFLCWIESPNMTFAIRINSCIGTRPKFYLFWIWVWNMPSSNGKKCLLALNMQPSCT